MQDKSCISYWFPKVAASGVAYPRTEIIRTDCELWKICDGIIPEGFEEFVQELESVAKRFGYPCFLRTGMGSGKHEWDQCCYVSGEKPLAYHVGALVVWSECASFLSLPYNVWAVREFLDLDWKFRCEAYGGFPVAREWRCFIRGGDVECIHPYWPIEAVKHGKPDVAHWRELLEELNDLEPVNDRVLQAAGAVAMAFHDDSYWSVDVSFGRNGVAYVTDMAVGEESFHWPECKKREQTK